MNNPESHAGNLGWDTYRGYQRGESEIPRVLPLRLAHEIQEHVNLQAATNDYTLGLAERGDLATDIVLGWTNVNAFSDPDIAFEALAHWRRVYGGEVSGE